MITFTIRLRLPPYGGTAATSAAPTKFEQKRTNTQFGSEEI